MSVLSDAQSFALAFTVVFGGIALYLVRLDQRLRRAEARLAADAAGTADAAGRADAAGTADAADAAGGDAAREDRPEARP